MFTYTEKCKGDSYMEKLKEYYKCSSMNMIVELTNACNLRCKYCFENERTDDGKKVVMSKKVLKKAIDFLMNDRKNVHLTFFGGEPLLCKGLLQFGIEYANKLAREEGAYVSFSVVTNGTKLDDDIINILNGYDVNIVYSFDGNKFSQNKYRPFDSGGASYEVVTNNLKKLISTRKDQRYGHLIVRPTITSDTIDLMEDIYNELIQIGCKEISFSLVSAKNVEDYAIKSADLDKLRYEYGKMTDNYYRELLEGYSYNKFFESMVERIEKNSINREFCDCGKRYMAIDTNGNIYPCEGFIGVQEFKMGNIICETMDNNWEMPQTVDENEECMKCWARYMCGGSCYHEAWMRTGTINARDKIVCETYRIAVEYALKLYRKMKNKDIHLDKMKTGAVLPERTIPIVEKNKVKRIEDDIIYINDGCDNNFVTINETAQRVYELCDGINSIQDISNVIIKEFQCEFDIYSDVSNTVSLLLDLGVLRLTV